MFKNWLLFAFVLLFVVAITTVDSLDSEEEEKDAVLGSVDDFDEDEMGLKHPTTPLAPPVEKFTAEPEEEEETASRPVNSAETFIPKPKWQDLGFTCDNLPEEYMKCQICESFMSNGKEEDEHGEIIWPYYVGIVWLSTVLIICITFKVLRWKHKQSEEEQTPDEDEEDAATGETESTEKETIVEEPSLPSETIGEENLQKLRNHVKKRMAPHGLDVDDIELDESYRINPDSLTEDEASQKSVSKKSEKKNGKKEDGKTEKDDPLKTKDVPEEETKTSETKKKNKTVEQEKSKKSKNN